MAVLLKERKPWLLSGSTNYFYHRCIELSTSSDRVWMALQLGWMIVEVQGRLSTNPLPHDPALPTRLYLSNLNPSDRERLWLATKRLITLANQLFSFSSDLDNDNTQNSNSANYPVEIDKLLEWLENHIRTGEVRNIPPSLKAEKLSPIFNHWSREIRSMLETENFILAEAATVGAGLAETFWSLPYPLKNQKSEEIWQDRFDEMFKPERTTAIIQRIRQIEDKLPDYLGPLLRHGVWECGIAGQLTRSSSGKLQVAYSWLYSWRSLSWINKIRYFLMKRLEEDNSPGKLRFELNEKQHSWRRIEKQMIKWNNLIFNHPPAYFLYASDWRHIRWLTLFFWSVLTMALISGAVFVVVALLSGVVWLLTLFRPSLAIPQTFEDQLTLVTVTITVLGFLWIQFRRFLHWLPTSHNSIHDWLLMRKLEQRTLIPWSWSDRPNKGQYKSIILIWLQRIFLAGGD